MDELEFYIKRCIALAANGFPRAMPNPSVGAVIVHENKIIGEGFTAAYGGNHAEVNAITAVKNKELLQHATLYVSLEPCSHFGKTPPCADLIILNKIKKVVIGAVDSNKKVAGKGIQKLRNAGIEVISGILENECREVNRRFFCFHENNRPYIILKWAQTADGFVAPENKTRDTIAPVWITNNYSRQLVHKWRSEEQAILVGTTTVLKDNPSLDVRDFVGKNPTRILIDRKGKVGNHFKIKDHSCRTIVFTEQKNNNSAGNLVYESCTFNQHLPNFICSKLQDYGIQSVLIEGGSFTLQQFLDAHLWDEARVFIGNQLFKKGTKAPNIPDGIVQKYWIKSDQLLKIKNYDTKHTI